MRDPNQRVLLPLMLLLTVMAVVGLLVESEIAVAVGGFGVLTCAVAWRWA